MSKAGLINDDLDKYLNVEAINVLNSITEKMKTQEPTNVNMEASKSNGVVSDTPTNVEKKVIPWGPKGMSKSTYYRQRFRKEGKKGFRLNTSVTMDIRNLIISNITSRKPNTLLKFSKPENSTPGNINVHFMVSNYGATSSNEFIKDFKALIRIFIDDTVYDIVNPSGKMYYINNIAYKINHKIIKNVMLSPTSKIYVQWSLGKYVEIELIPKTTNDDVKEYIDFDKIHIYEKCNNKFHRIISDYEKYKVMIIIEYLNTPPE